jgi:hypothetical protein
MGLASDLLGLQSLIAKVAGNQDGQSRGADVE